MKNNYHSHAIVDISSSFNQKSGKVEITRRHFSSILINTTQANCTYKLLIPTLIADLLKNTLNILLDKPVAVFKAS